MDLALIFCSAPRSTPFSATNLGHPRTYRLQNLGATSNNSQLGAYCKRQQSSNRRVSGTPSRPWAFRFPSSPRRPHQTRPALGRRRSPRVYQGKSTPPAGRQEVPQ
ncbi:hypothetical protein FA95DRAFT_1559064 [Auriscalpium vulgare]|uniref:Uncharacterized protein n=1 Tax=Auriscalpium vulgare TaxID=40419 RepID=A0ACB8RUI2_9AGAM|nr:hypothetical protein FA95DRAFT_1559064 [Auriscalpium vulgare]